MAAAEDTWLKDIRAKATVNHYEFGEKIVPMSSDQPASGLKWRSEHTHVGTVLSPSAVMRLHRNVALGVSVLLMMLGAKLGATRPDHGMAGAGRNRR